LHGRAPKRNLRSVQEEIVLYDDFNPKSSLARR
jgi:hypothetical protein